MIRRSLVASALAAGATLVARAVKADGWIDRSNPLPPGRWIDITTGLQIPGMGADIKLITQRWEGQSIRTIYVFPAGEIPCIIGIHEDDWNTWVSRVSTNINVQISQTQINQTQDNSIRQAIDNSIRDSFNRTTNITNNTNIHDESGSRASVNNC